jgi:hypothetical protein
LRDCGLPCFFIERVDLVHNFCATQTFGKFSLAFGFGEGIRELGSTTGADSVTKVLFRLGENIVKEGALPDGAMDLLLVATRRW